MPGENPSSNPLEFKAVPRPEATTPEMQRTFDEADRQTEERRVRWKAEVAARKKADDTKRTPPTEGTPNSGPGAFAEIPIVKEDDTIPDLPVQN